METYNDGAFREALLQMGLAEPRSFIQDNHSLSHRGVLRGLHYQLNPHPQGKLVRVTSGRCFDVAVDLRRRSPTFGRSVCVELSAEGHRQLWIPEGFAHGFLSLSEGTQIEYKLTDSYEPTLERTIRWDDATLAIPWPLAPESSPKLGPKDQLGVAFECAECFE